jgi:hypothetical protein
MGGWERKILKMAHGIIPSIYKSIWTDFFNLFLNKKKRVVWSLPSSRKYIVEIYLYRIWSVHIQKKNPISIFFI